MYRLLSFSNIIELVNSSICDSSQSLGFIFNEINFYESLWREKKSIYKDYSKVKENVFSLKSYIEKHVETKCLSHIDSVSDNFLFTKDGNIRLIDWEYSGMQDPHIDIAMFCIYAMYDKNKIAEVYAPAIMLSE